MKPDRPTFVKYLLAGLLGLLVMAIFLRAWWLGWLGHALVVDDPDATADVAVVLSTGVDYYPRLMQAAALYRAGRVQHVLVNGDRKTDALRELEAMGYTPAAPWYENSLRILELLGVPRGRVWAVPVENAFDSVSEAQGIKPFLILNDVHSIIITTSKFHTKRARYVWQKVMGWQQGIYTSAAANDPFDPDDWWTSGRQVKQVMGEYGGLVYYLWKAPWEE